MKSQNKKLFIVNIFLSIFIIFNSANLILSCADNGRRFIRVNLGIGHSMNPTIANRSLSVNVYPLNLKRFDIVVADADGEKGYQKRIIGMPGDHVEYKYSDDDKCYKYYINGVKQIEEFKTVNEPKLAPNYEYLDVVLGEDEYYIAGDNRYNSYDWRVFGPVKYEQIISKTIYNIDIAEYAEKK